MTAPQVSARLRFSNFVARWIRILILSVLCLLHLLVRGSLWGPLAVVDELIDGMGDLDEVVVGGFVEVTPCLELVRLGGI